MSIGSTILNILKSVLKIGEQVAPQIISAYSPALGALANEVLAAVVNAEGAVPGNGQGATKQIVSSLLLNAKGNDIATVFAAAGKPIQNPDLFAEAVNDLQTAVVKIMNSTGQGTKSVSAA